MALVFKGQLMVMSGQVEEGLALLDEATAAAVSGELQPLATGIVYCVTIDSCQSLGDCGRAAQWTDAANRWCDRTDITGFPGACRIHRAELLRLRGEWPKAEEQALQACEELQGYNGYITGHGFYEIGEIRRRRGDFAAAEEAYGRASEFGREPQPGLALLRLAQGKTEAAASAIRRELAAGDAQPARALEAPAGAGRDLARDRRGSPRARGCRGARGHRRHLPGRRQADARAPGCRLSRLGPDPAGGAGLGRRLASAALRARHLGEGRRAVRDRAGADAAGARVPGEGDEDGGREELLAAKRTFERLGAVLDLQRTAELLGESAANRTFMFTDIVDSTKLVEALGEDRWQKLLTWHDRKLRELIEQGGGEVIKHTGDGYFAAFQSAPAGGRSRSLDPACAQRARAARAGRAHRRPHGRRAAQGRR